TSSLTVALSVHEARIGRGRRAALFLAASMALGLVFLFLKGLEYAEHFHEGIFPGTDYRFVELQGQGTRMFFNLYFFMTGLHALHVIGGVVALRRVLLSPLPGEDCPAHHPPPHPCRV